MLHIHNPESSQNILWTRLKKGNGHLRKLIMDTLDSSMMKKMAADLMAKGKKLVPHTTRVVSSGQRRLLEFYSD